MYRTKKTGGKETRLFSPDEAVSPVGKSRVSPALIFFVLYTDTR
ncbi:Uncharacterized protein dnm_099670 [Desulfonema magnum]|uniref:Uncharacterized protein n=1 Tax=Desulfonema magnum TaxID=45655 RepID=A0A975BY00_9BACT|nr:Uncharacterized protein dnm_099670 [Desulfonema magnum]